MIKQITRARIGAIVTDAREDAGIRVSKMPVGYKVESRIEAGDANYNIDSLIDSCDALGLEVVVIPKELAKAMRLYRQEQHGQAD